MDCQKCGYALSAFEKDCPRCRRVAAEEFARSPASIWPPAVGPQVAAAPAAPLPGPKLSPQEFDNSSGEERGGPPEIEDLHWNWGAFFCGWLWCFFHRAAGLGVGVIAAGLLLFAFTLAILPAGYALPSELMALVVFGLCCYLGMTGHRTAWERRRFLGGVPQYLAVQRAWAVGGAAAFGVTLAFGLTLTFLFLAAFRAYEARRQAALSAPVAAPAPAAPAPIILRPNQPEPAPGPLMTPRGMNGNVGPGGYQRQFNPNYHGPNFPNPNFPNPNFPNPNFPNPNFRNPNERPDFAPNAAPPPQNAPAPQFRVQPAPSPAAPVSPAPSSPAVPEPAPSLTPSAPPAQNPALSPPPVPPNAGQPPPNTGTGQ